MKRARGLTDISSESGVGSHSSVVCDSIHNAMSFGYVRNSQSQQFVPPNAPPWKPENGFEFNSLLDVAPMLLLQRVVQYFVNVGGRTQHAMFSDSELRWRFRRVRKGTFV